MNVPILQIKKLWLLLQVLDTKGDNFTYPKVVSSIPFTDAGNTYFFDDTFNLSCGSSGIGGAFSRVSG